MYERMGKKECCLDGSSSAKKRFDTRRRLVTKAKANSSAPPDSKLTPKLLLIQLSYAVTNVLPLEYSVDVWTCERLVVHEGFCQLLKLRPFATQYVGNSVVRFIEKLLSLFVDEHPRGVR
mmetsp:Transcript_6046/g.12116  ORF Transcript_6046/g.12116 Transcript_6046/m.12116 type:complete len:120 (-) Transcript_6046:824-1183(-)